MSLIPAKGSIREGVGQEKTLRRRRPARIPVRPAYRQRLAEGGSTGSRKQAHSRSWPVMAKTGRAAGGPLAPGTRGWQEAVRQGVNVTPRAGKELL